MAKVKRYDDVLKTAFYFDQHDLEANRVGKLTDWQLNRLKADLRRATAALAILLFGALVVFGGGASIYTSGGQPSGLLTAAFVMLVVVGILALYYWFRNQRASADLREQKVSVVEGRVELRAVSSGESSTAYSVRIGEVQFPLKKQEFLAFKNGDPYRVYYAPNSKKLLSAEWLRGDENLVPD